MKISAFKSTGSNSKEPKKDENRLINIRLPLINQKGSNQLQLVREDTDNMSVRSSHSVENKSGIAKSQRNSQAPQTQLKRQYSKLATPSQRIKVKSSLDAFTNDNTTEKKDEKNVQINKLVESFKQSLLDIKTKLKKEESNYMTREYSRKLSVKMYLLIINLNIDLRSLNPMEEQHALKTLRDKLKPFEEFRGYLLPFVSSSILNHDFIYKEEFDWMRRVYFLSKIEILQTEQIDPIHRILVRKHNKLVFYSNKTYDDTHQAIANRLIEADSPRLSLIAMQYGLLTEHEALELLQNMAGKLKPLLLYTKGFKKHVRYEDPEVEATAGGRHTERGITIMDEDEGDKIMSGLDKFLKLNKRKDVERASDILKMILHCIVQINDCEIESRLRTPAEDTNLNDPTNFSVDHQALFKEIKSTLFQGLVEDNFEGLIGLKDQEILTMIVQVLDCLVGDCNDLYGSSLKVFLNTDSVNKRHGWGLENESAFVTNDEAQRKVDLLHTVMLEIVEGRRSEVDFQSDTELQDQIHAALCDLEDFLNKTSSLENVPVMLIARRLSVANILHLLLNLAVILTASTGTNKPRTTNSIRSCLTIAQSLFQHYPPAKCLLFGGKEWFFFQRLYQFYPCECLLLLWEAINDNQQAVLSCQPKAMQMLDFLATQLGNEMPKFYEAASYSMSHHGGLKSREPGVIAIMAQTNEAGIAILLMLRVCQVLFDKDTEQLTNRKYSVILQRRLLLILETQVWPFLRSFDNGDMYNKDKPDNLDFIVALKRRRDLVNLHDKYTEVSSTKSLMIEVCFMTIQTLNHTCLYSRIFSLDELDRSFSRCYSNANQLRLSFFGSLFNFADGALVVSELAKLLSHSYIMEYSLVKQDYSRTDVLKETALVHLHLHRFYNDLEYLMLQYDKYVENFNLCQGSLHLEIFTVRAILEPTHKLFSGILKLAPLLDAEDDSQEIAITLETICSLLNGKSPDGTLLYGQLFVDFFMKDHTIRKLGSIKVMLGGIVPTLSRANSTKRGRSTSQRKLTALGGRSSQEKQNKPTSLRDAITDIKDALETVLNDIKIHPIKNESQLYKHDSRDDLQTASTTLLSTMPEDGCLNMIHFRSKIAQCIELSTNSRKVFTNDTEDSTEMNDVITELSNTHAKRLPFKDSDEDLVKACDLYLKVKRSRSSSDDSSVIKKIDDGVDEQPDAYYLMILYLIARELSQTRDLYFNQMKLENMHNSKFKFVPLDVMIASRPSMIQLMKIFDNLLYLQGSKVRQLFYDTFFEESLDGVKHESDDNDIKPKTGSALSPFKPLKQMGSKAIELLFHAVISLQRKIIRSVFQKDSVADCQLYFLLCYNIKSLAEENFLEMKQLFQRLKIDIDNKHLKSSKLKREAEGEFIDQKIRTRNQVSAFSLLLKGIIVPKNEAREIEVRSLRKTDRPELVWYNIITLMLLSELSFGLDSIPEDISASKINSMILFFNNINVDVFSPQFDMLEETARLLSYLLESSPQLVDNLLNLKRPDKIHPDQMYMQIVTMIKLLVVSFIKIADMLSNRTRVTEYLEAIKKSMEADIDKIVSNTDILVDYYKKYQKFANHPIIKIGRLLNRIMNTMAYSTSNRQFATYTEQLKRESELMEATNYNKAGKAIHRIAQSVLTTFKKNKKQGKSRSRLESKFQGIVLYNFLHRISATVEIAVQDKKSMILEFAIIPEAFFISEITKKHFVSSVAIGDHNAKLVNMMDSVDIFSQEGKINYRLSQHWPLLSLVTSNEVFQFFVVTIWIISAVINGIALFTMNFHDTMDISRWHWMTLFVGNLTIIGLSIFISILYIATKSDKETSLKLMQSKYSQIKQERFFNKTIVGWKILVMALENFILHQQILLCCSLYIIFSSLSLIGYWYFMPFQLLMFAQVSQTAAYIIQSIRLHYDQLIRTFFILLLLIYTYTLIIGVYFREDFSVGKNLCENMWSCFIYCADLGLRTGGGVANVMTLLPYKDSMFFPKFFLDMTHFIFINMISLNIFAGIIIDTFSELRKRLEARSKLV